MSHHLILDLATAPIDGAEMLIDGDTISPPANYRDPEKIAAYIAEKKQERLERAGLDLDLCRITAIGFLNGNETPVVTVCKTEDDEMAAIRFLMDELGYDGQVYSEKPNIVTYNGFRFDLPVLLRRCAYLGLPIPPLNLDRYRSPHVDLCDALTHRGVLTAKPLTFYVRRLGWTDLVKPLSGAEEARAAAEGRWDEIAAAVRHDVIATTRLARWLRVIPQLREAVNA